MHVFLAIFLPFAAAFYSYHEDPRLLQSAYLKSLIEDFQSESEKRWNDGPKSEIFLEEELRDSPDEYDEEVPIDLDLTGLKHQSIRDSEYLRHSSLNSKTNLAKGKHEDDFNAQEYAQKAKSENVLPAYCNPPNPCPVGYTEKDGCIEVFENTAAFSRAYQAAQDCMCDTEHMFDCQSGSPRGPSRTPHKPVDSSLRRFMAEIKQIPDEHKTLVAKKFFDKRGGSNPSLEEIARLEGAKAASKAENPYLVGEKLPVAAKKGFGS